MAFFTKDILVSERHICDVCINALYSVTRYPNEYWQINNKSESFSVQFQIRLFNPSGIYLVCKQT